MKRVVYNRLPDSIQPKAKQLYFSIQGKRSDQQLRSTFIDEFFDSQTEYEQYVTEFKTSNVADIHDEAHERYRELTGRDSMITLPMEKAQDYYAIVRHLQPSVVIETGVCHGMSTLSVLLALRENEDGDLYSIDYPFYVDDSIDSFREETYEEFGGAALPADEEPGWIIPNDLRERWTLMIGKSQRELPKLLPELDGLDLFIHDSEHSTPCMMFEYELAWEWLGEAGTIISDDITWGEAWSLFIKEREPEYGRFCRKAGYMQK